VVAERLLGPATRHGLLAILGVLTLTGCYETPGAPSWGPECELNSPPFVGNLSIIPHCISAEALEVGVGPETPTCPGWASPWDPTSIVIPVDERPFAPGEGFTWAFETSFQWADPGRQGATDPPNLTHGFIRTVFSGYATEQAWIRPADSQTFLPGDIPMDADAAQGTLDRFYVVEEGSDLYWGTQIEFSVRIYDRCDAPSNAITGNLIIGAGPWIEENGGHTFAEPADE
jgi:hypothetical protein